MFHDITPQIARQSFRYLSRYYSIISMQEFQEALLEQDLGPLPRKAMIITFDDGHRQNFEILSILEEYGVSATIFLCAGIVNTNRHYWFKANPTGKPTDDLKKLPNQKRLEVLAEAGFRQEVEYEDRQALNRNEMLAMASTVDFQAHTVFHPILPTCEDEESWQEIAGSKEMLEQDFGLQINAFAYPNGDYGSREVDYLKKAGYKMAVTVEPGFNSVSSDPFQLKRLSSNDTADMNELIVKSSGLWYFLRKFTKPKMN